MPCKALHDLMVAHLLDLITLLFPPSSIQCSHNTCFLPDAWTWQGCSLVRARARAAWNILLSTPRPLQGWLPYPLWLSVLSEEVSLTILYKIVPSSFSKPLPIVLVTAQKHCVTYLCKHYIFIYSFVCCWTPPVERQLHEGREFVLFAAACHTHYTVPGVAAALRSYLVCHWMMDSTSDWCYIQDSGNIHVLFLLAGLCFSYYH